MQGIWKSSVPVVLLLTGCFSGQSGWGESAVSAAPPDAAAQADEDENPHVWQPRTTSVSVFKNGYGFFMREGDVALREGWCVAEAVPPATFGTLITYSHREGEVVDVVGSGPGEVVEFDGVDAPDDDGARRSRLNALLNVKLQLTYEHKGRDRSAAGRLVSVGPEFAVLEDADNSFAVPVSGITRLQLLELPLRIHVSGDGAAQPNDTRLGMAYLRKGITWISEYSLKILDDETAELTLRGTLVNEAEDLVHCDVNLVVGVPHFEHTNFLSPVAVGQVIRTIGTSVAPPQLQGQIMMRGAIVANSITSNDFGNGQANAADDGAVVERAVPDAGGNLDAALGNLPTIDGGAASDFTVYTRKDLTLRRGEKAILTLFRKKIRFSHSYRWEIPGRLRHFLRLENATDTAWTTGACLAVSDARPLSEDLLKYTPKGGRALFPVTTAVNVSHEKSEVEIERKFKAHNPTSNVYFDLVTLEGRLKLKNFESRDVEITVVAPVPGKPIQASDDGELSVDPTKLRLLERQGRVTWSLTLKPGESRTLTYRYERYVESR